MKKITLSIEDHKFQFFLELIKNLEFVQINENEQVADWFDELTPTQKKTIQISREEIKKGEGISHQEVQRKVRKIIEQKKTA